MSADELHVPPVIRRAYERGRIRVAFEQTAPLAVLALLASVFFTSWPTIVVGVALLVFAVLVAWRGGRAGRIIGIASQVAWLPPALMLFGEPFGGACGLSELTSLFVAVGVICGVMLGGFLVARASVRLEAGYVGWAVASLIVVGAGSLGCLCIPAGSALGLAIALVSSATLSLPVVVRSPSG